MRRTPFLLAGIGLLLAGGCAGDESGSGDVGAASDIGHAGPRTTPTSAGTKFTSESSVSSARPSALRWGECPADVEATFISPHECGILTVLADRAEPDGPTIDLLLVRAWPVGVETKPGVVFGFGGNIGDPRGLTGGLATGATRLRSLAVAMEARGAGPHTTPRLNCPEVDELSAGAAGSPTSDRAVTRDFVAAVKACAHRLRAEGVDPADYGVAAMAADADDLRAALGIDQWAVLGTEGTTSRVLFEYLRAYPDRAATAFVDSPWFPEVDDLTGGVEGTRHALNELFTTCERDPDCAAAYPHLDRTWKRALDRLAVTPLRGTTGTAAGGEIDVLIDAPKLLRAARFALGGDGPAAAGALPATIAAAARGEATPWLLATSAEDPLFCVGYRPFCSGQQGFSLGAYLTAFCAEQEPFIDDTALAAAIDGDAVYEAVFAASPYRAACPAWSVPPGNPSIVDPVDTASPVLLLPGQFDSFTTTPAAEAAAARLTSATVLEVPGQTHNTLGFAECAIGARNTWAEHPTVTPPVDACTDAPPLSFVPGDTAEQDADSLQPGSTVDQSGPASGIPDGTYEMTLTRQQAIDTCLGEETAYDETTVQVVLDRGSWEVWVQLGGRNGPRELGAAGTYEVSGPRIIFTESGFPGATAQWSFDGTTLVFSGLDHRLCAQTIWDVNPWVLIDRD
jgi:pimeloyl-ACP methyl ester carboxylesterase